MRFPPVAIIGQGCVLPGALSPDALWSLVREGRSALRRSPPGLWRLSPNVDRSKLVAEVVSDVGGYVDGFEAVFDPSGFRLPSAQIVGLDEVFRWTLHAAHQALVSAGIDPTATHPRGTIVLGNLGYPTPRFIDLALEIWSRAPRTVDPRERYMSGLPAHIVAAALGFEGGAFTLDAACASSLYAIKLACDRLHDGRADVALAGGVNHADDLFLHGGFSALHALSPTGRSRPFHREADGLVPAQGAAMLVLERLEDAIRAGRNIRGVIRGIGLSNDGRSKGLMVPAQEGQVRALRAAYATSGLTPGDISLIECHATGTTVGDGTEIRSMREVFEGARGLPLGSLKSNVGHLITASGAAAIIKVLGAMEAGVRPPTLHADAPHAELTDGMFRLLAAEEPWPADGPRRAAVSNFGFGGNNAHLLLESWAPRTAWSGSSRAAHIAPAVEQNVPIAVIAQSVWTGGASDDMFADELFTILTNAETSPTGAGTLEIEAGELRFPPTDLKAALPQQLALLVAAAKLAPEISRLPVDRTGLFVGMQCDAEVARNAIRWRANEAWTATLPKALASEPLSAASVIGCMPNIVANRLGHQLGLEGPSFTISSEEASGTIALDLAIRAIRAGEIDAALVCAVDLSCEPITRTTAREVLPEGRHRPGDAAILMVLERHADALGNGDQVLAVVEARPSARPVGLDLSLTNAPSPLSARFGHSHAASGLLHVAAAIEACARRALPSRVGPMPWLPRGGERDAHVRIEALGGQTTTTEVSTARGATIRPVLLGPCPRLGVFSAETMAGLVQAVERRESNSGRRTFRVAIVAETPEEYEHRLNRAAALLRTLRPDAASVTLDDGIYFGSGAMPGELAFVFTGVAGAYPHMGRDLALALPELVDRFAARAGALRDAAGWVYDDDPELQATPIEKLWGGSYLCQLHTELTRRTLGLSPTAAIGYCSGETNALFALDAWSDFDGFRRDVIDSHVYDRELCGELACVRRAWRLPPAAPAEWATWRVRTSVDEVRRALASEPRAHLVIINTPTDVVIAGEPDACARVAKSFGPRAARTTGYDFVMHCPEARELEDGWRALHTRPTADVQGMRFYTHATGASYQATSQSVADALTGQAMSTVDFPALVERAWSDGVRVFIEHGPHSGCARWIDDILGDRPHVAVSLDRYGRSSLLQAVDATARLVAAGVPVAHEALTQTLADVASTRNHRRAVAPRRSLRLVMRAHPEDVPPPPIPSPAPDARHHASATADDIGEWMAPAPTLAPVTGLPPVRQPPEPRAAAVTPQGRTRVDPLVAHHTQLADLHRAFLRQQIDIQSRFVSTMLANHPLAQGAPILPSAPAHRSHDGATSGPQPQAGQAGNDRVQPPLVVSRPAGVRTPTGPRFDRAQLEVHATGAISTIFGEQFRKQDGFARQVRMPEPPLLLADRVLGIEGAPGELGLGTIWTETDVTEGKWYLHEGRMPAGVLVESGQADLMLISWLGADFLNRGERVYRLLGCELRSHGPLPTIGDTLHYQISVDGHAEQDGIRLFFFHYDCWVNGEIRMSVRNGQAGFFTDDELAGSAGVLWSAEATEPRVGACVDPPVAVCTKMSFGREDVAALIEGRIPDCFGPGFERANTHTRTPTIAGGRMRLVDEVTHIDPCGGPWKRGYLRATLALTPDSWFFRGHFKNDPCMPGTLMLEGGLQAMQIFMTSLGHTLDHDGDRFEPAPEETYGLRCRGQATPASKEVVYEIFVEEIVAQPIPTLYADILGTVDGRKAFHCRRMALRLVPAWPLDAGRIRAAALSSDDRPVAVVGGFEFEYASLLACAWGKPSSAFGPMYARFDGPRRVARLPGPPYHFMSRVTRVDGPIGGMVVGSTANIDYDVPRDAWYFRENNTAAMPFAVLLETALQPCGWLASYVGGALDSEHDLYFRNLDGTGTQRREITPNIGTLTVTTTLTNISTADAIVIMAFDVVMRAGSEVVYTLKTVFGFFPGDTMRNQAGLPTTPEQRAALEQRDRSIDLTHQKGRFFGSALRLATDRLLLLDRITGIFETGGKAGLGRLIGEKAIAARQWFFKAHFFQDPVQPGSLGIEAMLQGLQALAIGLDLGRGIEAPRFETQASDVTMNWKYRGQVVPENRVVIVDIEITEVRRETQATLVLGAGSLWVDGKRIYEAQGLGVRIVTIAE